MANFEKTFCTAFAMNIVLPTKHCKYFVVNALQFYQKIIADLLIKNNQIWKLFKFF